MAASQPGTLEIAAASTAGHRTELTVHGMTCQNCARHVTDALRQVPGVSSALVTLETGRASVRWADHSAPDTNALIAAVQTAGYQAQVATPPPAPANRTELAIAGLDCPNCVHHVTEALQAVPGVAGVQIDLETAQGSVSWQAHVAPDVTALLAALTKAGYPGRVLEPAASAGHDHAQHVASGWQSNLTLGIGVTVPLMLGDWVFNWSDQPWFRWLSFALAATVQVFAGARFYRGAWNQLKVGNSNMDTLVALGSTTAFVYSAWALLAGWPTHLYFMEAAAIITLISLGHWLEARVSARASSSLRALMQLAPDTARRRDASGQELEVPVAQLHAGDVVLVRPGDRVTVDGTVLEGESAVDESMLTGESAPVDKARGAPVYGGTVNLNGRLAVRVTATGEATALAHIIEAVQRAQSSRANIQRLGDRVSSVFVPVVVVIAILTVLWWGLMPDHARHVAAFLSQFLWPIHVPEGPLAAAIIGAAAVLIIACPCAMGLATPAAIMAASNAAAQRGFLIRDGVALEKAGQVTAVLFDKTGTITTGKPAVVRVLPFSEAPVERIAASLARDSSHPVSQAVAKLSDKVLPVIGWQEVRGAGVQGSFPASAQTRANGLVRLGSLAWLRDAGVQLDPGELFVAEWTAKGATLIGLASDRALLALIAVQDTLKPHAAAVVARLAHRGLKVHLVTGDNPATAASLAAQAGIPRENVFAEVRPEQKAELVKKLQSKGERVAFVGDGINDAPALEQADLGIAVSRASDIAREAADIILLNSDVEAVADSLGLAKATLRTIKQNLFWAFFYNALGIPLAALGFMSPVLCAAAMGFSDMIVLGNALRLKRWKD